MKSLRTLSIKNLFGHFNYDIDFAANNGYTILVAPNSFGKSTILKIIRAALRGDPLFFYTIDFEEIKFEFTDDSDLQITRSDCAEPSIDFSFDEYFYKYECSTIQKMEKLVDERIEGLKNVTGPKEICARWRRADQDSGNDLDISEVYRVYGEDKFKDFISENISWMPKFKKNFFSKVFYFVKGLYEPYEAFNDFCDAEGIRSMLKLLIDGAHKRFSASFDTLVEEEASGRLDLVLASDAGCLKDCLYEETMNLWIALRDHFAEVDKLNIYFGREANGETMFDSLKPCFDHDLQTIALSRVRLDILETMSFDELEELQRKMMLIQETLNKMLFFKNVQLGGPEILKVVDDSGKEIPLHKLSSGENQLIGTFGLILFYRSPNQDDLCIIMDEPETSLHPAWQEELASFCYEANQEFGQQFIFASHSPVFIGNYRSHMVDLYEQGMSGK